MKLFVVTASRLRDGAILWLGQGSKWCERFEQAEPFAEEAVEAALQFGAQEAAAQRVVGVYKVEVEKTESGAAPLSVRERIRAMGPSVRPDLSYVAILPVMGI